MTMLKRLRRQNSAGTLASGSRLLPRLGSRNSLTSLHNVINSSPKSSQPQVPEAEDQHQLHRYTHDATGRRYLDQLITTRQWDCIRTLLSTDDGRHYIRSVSVLLHDTSNFENTNDKNDHPPNEKFISIFHHIVLSNPPLDVLADLIHLIGVSQLLCRDDIRYHYNTKRHTSIAPRRGSNSATRIVQEGLAWTPLHTAVAFCCSDETSNNNRNAKNSLAKLVRRQQSQPRVDASVVRILLRHFPALPSITCGTASVTPLMIEASKGSRANLRLVKSMIDACPTAILIADAASRTAVEYALGGENLRLYRNLHHLLKEEIQKLNGLEARKRMAHHSLMGGGSRRVVALPSQEEKAAVVKGTDPKETNRLSTSAAA